MLHLAELWLPIIGGAIFIAGGFAAWFGENKVAAVWLFFFGLVCFLLLAALQFQEALQSEPAPGAAQPTAADIARDRAYIAPSDATVVNLLSETPTVTMLARNFGRTPAYKLTWAVNFSITTYPVIPDIPIGTPPFQPPYEVPPDGTLSQQWTFPKLSDDIVAKLTNGTAAVVAIGEINYTDAFGVQRYTRFKLYSANIPSISAGKFVNAESGNESN